MLHLDPDCNRRHVQGMLRDLKRDVRDDWTNIVTRSGCNVDAIGWLPKKTLNLLGSSTKVEKSAKLKIDTKILYLAPSDLSGRNVCPWKTVECSDACLGHSSGHMIYDSVRRAQIWKTALRFGNPFLFHAILECEIWLHLDKNRQDNVITSAIRCDGTSDLGTGLRYANLAQAMGGVIYDYTKSARRAYENIGQAAHITLSFTGYNTDSCRHILESGGTVAVVFNTKKVADFPDTWQGFTVVNGDADDATFLSPGGTVRALTFKGNTSREAAGLFLEPCKVAAKLLTIA